jgi:hypothetical protein
MPLQDFQAQIQLFPGSAEFEEAFHFMVGSCLRLMMPVQHF